MEETTREGFANVLAEIAKVGADAREAASRSRETSVAVSKLTGDVERLNKAVFGGNPPSTPPPVAIAARITEGEGTVADLTGRVMALQSSHEEHVRATAEYREKNDAKLEKLDQKQDQQLETLGTIAKAVTGFTSNPLVKKAGMLALSVLVLWLTAQQAKLQLHGVLP